jgi:anti-anti-sigma regulatory factor
VGALVKLNRAAAAAGTALGLRAVSRRVAAMLHITGIDTVIALSDSHDSSR